VETSTRVRKGYDRNCLHHDLEVLNNPVPPPRRFSGLISLYTNPLSILSVLFKPSLKAPKPLNQQGLFRIHRTSTFPY
jgi:hypothetical protein